MKMFIKYEQFFLFQISYPFINIYTLIFLIIFFLIIYYYIYLYINIEYSITSKNRFSE